MKLLFKDMRSKLLIALALLATVMIPEVKATEPTDTIYNPPMFFTGMPKKYEIAGIRVSGLQNYEDYIVIGYSVCRWATLWKSQATPSQAPQSDSGDRVCSLKSR